MYILIENNTIHRSELVTMVFELSLRLRPAPLRCPHGDCGSRSIIKYGKGKRKNIPDVQRYLCKACGRTFCDRAGTPYYRKHYPALVMLTCLDLFHSLNTPMRRQARLVPHVPRKPSHRTVMRWQRDLALFFTRLKKARLNSGRVWLGDECYLRLGGKRVYQHVVLDSDSRAVLSSLLVRRKSQLEAEAIIRWAHERTGRLPEVFVSDSNAAFGAALENLGLEKTVTHEVVNHSDGFLNPRGYGTNLLERLWGTFTEWYENPAFRGFKTWRNTYPYCEAFSVYYNFVRPHSSLRGEEPRTPADAAGFKHAGSWSTLIEWMRNHLN